VWAWFLLQQQWGEVVIAIRGANPIFLHHRSLIALLRTADLVTGKPMSMTSQS